MITPALSAIRSNAGRKGGKSPKATPAGFKALSPESRDAVSRMGVEARRKMPTHLRLDKRLCYLDDCRAKPCPIRIRAFGNVFDVCCWSHALVVINNELDKVQASLND